MNLRCPDCLTFLPLDAVACHCGRRITRPDGIMCLIPEEERDDLERFVAALARWRSASGARLEDPAVYDCLPATPPDGDDGLWRLRRRDLALARRELSDGRPRRVLDYGAWNCWLAHRLALDGHHVVAADLFVDPFDGLGAARHYSRGRWTTVQIDPRRPDLLPGPFDLIVFNRNLATLPPSYDVLDAAFANLAPGGCLMVTGVTAYRRHDHPESHFAALRDELRRAGVDLPWDMKLWIGAEDVDRLRAKGFEVQRLPGPWWRPLLEVVDRDRPQHLVALRRR